MKIKIFASFFIIVSVLNSCSLIQNPDDAAQSTLKIAAASLASSEVFIDNGSIWTDAQGNEIKAQGGCIIKVEASYHWFGPQFGATGDYKFYAINHYVSSDLKNWDKQTPALIPGTSGIPFKSTSWVGRPWVMWNPNDNRYVMALEWGGNETGVRNQYAFLTSPSINGPWNYHSDKLIKKLPDVSNALYPLGDMGLYAEGGNAWLLYTFDKPQANYSQAILKLGSDFMTPLPPTPGNYTEFSGGTWKAGVQEAATAFKKGDTYYYFTSLCNGWKSSETRYRTAPSMAGPWTANEIVTTNPASTNSFNTQHDFVLPIIGANSTTYVYFGDRWNNYTNDGSVGRNAWYPIIFDTNGKPTIQAPDYDANGGDWLLDVAQGTWRKPSANKILNPGFENDFTSWSFTGNASIATASTEIYAGTKAVKSWSSNAYTTTLQNASGTNCTAGTYSAKVWSRAGGTFNQRLFQIYINDVKTKEITLPVTTTWTQYGIDSIEVPEGATVKVVISLDAAARAWTQFDEFSLEKN
jgi:hypothetical protein